MLASRASKSRKSHLDDLDGDLARQEISARPAKSPMDRRPASSPVMRGPAPQPFSPSPRNLMSSKSAGRHRPPGLFPALVKPDAKRATVGAAGQRRERRLRQQDREEARGRVERRRGEEEEERQRREARKNINDAPVSSQQ